MRYRMSVNHGHPVIAATRALRFADHVTKRNGGSGDENERETDQPRMLKGTDFRLGKNSKFSAVFKLNYNIASRYFATIIARNRDSTHQSQNENNFRPCWEPVSRLYIILVPRASVSFGHVVDETEGSGSSNYRMSVNHGHPVTHAYYLPAYLLMLRN